MLCASVDIEIASIDTNRLARRSGDILMSMGLGRDVIHLLYCGIAKVTLLHANTVIRKTWVGESCKSS